MKITQESLLKIAARRKLLSQHIEEIDANIATLKAEKADLQEFMDELNKEVIDAMKESGQKKAEFDFVKATIPKAQKTVSITDDKKIPACFKTYEEVQKIDKKAIKKAIDSGEFVGGAELIDGKVSVKIEELES